MIKKASSAAARILPIVDQKNKIKDHISSKPLIIDSANIKFDKLNFPAKPRWALDEKAAFLKGAGVKL